MKDNNKNIPENAPPAKSTVNEVRIYKRPERVSVDVFRDDGPAKPEKKPALPILVAVGVVVAVIVVGVLLAYALSSMLSSGDTNKVGPFKADTNYLLVLKEFDGDASKANATAEMKFLKEQKGVVNINVYKTPRGDSYFLALGPYVKGEEEIVKGLMGKYEGDYPKMRLDKLKSK